MRRARGFSLAELTIAVLILSALSVVIVGVIPATVLGVRSAGSRATAAMVAREILEDCRRAGLGRLEARDLDNVPINGVVYTRRIELADARDFNGNLLAHDEAREVRATITWMDRGHRKSFIGCTVIQKR